MNDNKEMSANDDGAHIHNAYVKLPTELLADVARGVISEAAFTLYAFLVFWQGPHYDTFCGISAMARETGFSEGKVKRLLKELLAAGHIRRTRKMGATWRTKCMTVVQDGYLFKRAKGKRIGAITRQKQKSNGSCSSVEEPRQTQPKERTQEPRDEFKLFEKAPAPDETKIREESIDKVRDDSWMEKIPWDARLRLRFDYYDTKYQPMKAKRLFLEEVSGESPELEQLYKGEFPNGGDDEMEPLF